MEIELTRSRDEIVDCFATLYERKDVANLLEITDGDLVHILFRSAPRRMYREFSIPKKSGGTRIIAAPPPSLQILQTKLNHVLQIVYRRKGAAHGFIRDRSILTNAIPHVGKRWVLNVDLEDFFPSINFGRVRGMFKGRPYHVGPSAASVLARLCCNENSLPQGAPTSPMVSNMICARLDGELQRLARKHRCSYTRYADDITFSTSQWEFPAALASLEQTVVTRRAIVGPSLLELILQNGFRINEAKVRLQFHDCHQSVTGITVNRVPNLPRSYVRGLRVMMHAWRRYGYESAEQTYRENHTRRSRRPGSGEPSLALVLKGKVEYLGMIKGTDDPVYRRYKNLLHELAPTLVAAAPAVMTTNVVSHDDSRADKLWSNWFEKYRDLVFHLEVQTKRGETGAGTAFAYGAGVLATAAHNLAGKLTVGSPLSTGIEPLATHMHRKQKRGCDIAVLYVPKDDFPASLPLNERLPSVGELVAVLAYATVPQRQPTLGLYAGYVETIAHDYRREYEFIQLSITPAGGMSGGPVINRAGEVIGVVVEETFAKSGKGAKRQFCHALPIRHAKEVG